MADLKSLSALSFNALIIPILKIACTIIFHWIFCGVFCVSCVSHAFASVHCCLVVTCWERADLLAFVGDVYSIFVTFPYPGSGVVLDCIYC